MTRALIMAALLAAGCRPDDDDRPSRIDALAILAVVAEPAEAGPGDEVAFHALVVDPDGAVDPVAADWSFCTEPKLPAENNVVAPGCLDGAIDRIARGAADAAAAIPDDACTRFGPDPPPGDFRPRDPDATGGYYQPLRVDVDDATAIGLARVQCNLANAPIDVAMQYRATYVRNANPTLLPIEADPPLDAVPAGAEVRLRAAWPAAAVERFPVYEQASRGLVEHGEAMRVSWYATAGELALDRTGVGEGEGMTRTDNHWTAPEEPGDVHLWVVLRDSRGGTAYAGLDAHVIHDDR